MTARTFAQSLHQCAVVVREMALDRGFVPDASWTAYAADPAAHAALSRADELSPDAKAALLTTTTLWAALRTNPRHALMMRFCNYNRAVRIQTVVEDCCTVAQRLCEKIAGGHTSQFSVSVLLVAWDGRTTAAIAQTLAKINRVNPRFMQFELWERAALQVNITRHVDVPPHRRIPPNAPELVALRAEKHDPTIERKFPTLFTSDPIARWYGFVAGDLIRIERCDDGVGPYVYYRRCERATDAIVGPSPLVGGVEGEDGGGGEKQPATLASA